MQQRGTLRIVLMGLVMAGLIIALAFPSLFTRTDDTSPRATACRAEAMQKFPAEMEEIQNTGGGTGRVMLNKNAKAYGAAYAVCMDR